MRAGAADGAATKEAQAGAAALYLYRDPILLLASGLAHPRRRFRPGLVRKNFQDFPSHRIFGRMHGALNINENKN